MKRRQSTISSDMGSPDSWDVFDAKMKKTKGSVRKDVHNQFLELSSTQNKSLNIANEDFSALSFQDAKDLIDKDENERLQFLNSNMSFSDGIEQVEAPSLLSVTNYFQQGSSFPVPYIGNDSTMFGMSRSVLLPPTSPCDTSLFKYRSNSSTSQSQSLLRHSKNKSDLASEQVTNQVVSKSNELPRSDSLEQFFLGPQSDGLDKMDIMDYVLDYCKRRASLRLSDASDFAPSLSTSSNSKNSTPERHDSGIGIGGDEKTKCSNKNDLSLRSEKRVVKENVGVDRRDVKENSRPSKRESRESTRLDRRDARENLRLDKRDVPENSGLDKKDVRENSGLDKKDVRESSGINKRHVRESSGLIKRDVRENISLNKRDVRENSKLDRRDVREVLRAEKKITKEKISVPENSSNSTDVIDGRKLTKNAITATSINDNDESVLIVNGASIRDDEMLGDISDVGSIDGFEKFKKNLHSRRKHKDDRYRGKVRHHEDFEKKRLNVDERYSHPKLSPSALSGPGATASLERPQKKLPCTSDSSISHVLKQSNNIPQEALSIVPAIHSAVQAQHQQLAGNQVCTCTHQCCQQSASQGLLTGGGHPIVIHIHLPYTSSTSGTVVHPVPTTSSENSKM